MPIALYQSLVSKRSTTIEYSQLSHTHKKRKGKVCAQTVWDHCVRVGDCGYFRLEW